MEWNEILEKLPIELRVEMEAAAVKINKEYYDKSSPHYRDNERYGWAVKSIMSHYEEKISSTK